MPNTDIIVGSDKAVIQTSRSNFLMTMGAPQHHYDGALLVSDTTPGTSDPSYPLISLARGSYPNVPARPSLTDSGALNIADFVLGNNAGGVMPSLVSEARMLSGAMGILSAGKFSAIAGGTYNPVNTAVGGTIGLKVDSVGLAGASYAQYPTGLQLTVRGENTNDILQGIEIDLSTRQDATTIPGQRIGLTITTSGRSSQASGLDAMIRLIKKMDTALSQPFKDGIVFGDGYGTPGSFPIAPTGTMIRAQAGQVYNALDLSQLDIAGSVLQSKTFNLTGNGYMGVGTVSPLSPLHIEHPWEYGGIRLAGPNMTGTNSGHITWNMNPRAWFHVTVRDTAGNWIVGKVPVY